MILRGEFLHVGNGAVVGELEITEPDHIGFEGRKRRRTRDRQAGEKQQGDKIFLHGRQEETGGLNRRGNGSAPWIRTRKREWLR